VVLAISALCQPGLLVGAGLAAATLIWPRPARWLRWIAALAMAGLAFHFLPDVQLAWPERIAGTAATALWPTSWSLHLSFASIGKTVAYEALVGPLWLQALLWEEQVRTGRLSHVVMREAKAKRAYQKAFASRISLGGLKEISHPSGALRLGVEGKKPFDLALPASLARHVTVLGKTGSGKTTTALRIMQGAISAGYPIVIVDAKGLGSLRRNAEVLAEGLPFQVVAPGDPKTLGYNPCTGTPAQISNKLIGAFAYGAEAEIYKNIVQETLPIVVRGLQATGETVTLTNIAAALDQKRMLGLAARVGDKDDDARQLLADFSGRGSLYTAAFAGMRARLGALMHGEFGEVFSSHGAAPALDLAAAFRNPGISYISLPAMASSEDVGLMARVLVQDIKQVAAARIAGSATAPALLVLDEFAALQDAQQLNDLLLQAREAGIACVVCTQFLPPAAEAPLLRNALMGAGVFIAHQCGPEDAEPVATLFGTETRLDPTHQIDYQTGYSEKGSVRLVHEYIVHPDFLRSLPRGKVAVRADDVGTVRVATVEVALPASSTNASVPVEPPTPSSDAPAEADLSTAPRFGRAISFIDAFYRAIEGDGILLWAAGLLIGWEGFFQWPLAALYGATLALGLSEAQLGAHSYLGLTGAGAIAAVIITAVLAIAVGAILGIVTFPVLAIVWMLQNPQATMLWAGLGFALALGVTIWRYIAERSVGIRDYRVLTTAEQDFVLPLYHEVAMELRVHNVPRLLIGDSPLPGAGAHLATITLTTALLERPRQEIAAVLAHELGHHINGHALRLRFAWACALPITVLYGVGLTLRETPPGPSPIPQTPLGVDPVGFHLQLVRAGASSARSVVGLVPRLIGDVAYFMAWPAMNLMLLPSMAAACRRMELEADAVVAQIGGAEALAHHLRLAQFADWTDGGWEAFGLRTHPPVAVRIDHLSGTPRRSSLDPVTRLLDRVIVLGIHGREFAFGGFIAGVLVASVLGLLHLGGIH